MGDPIGLAIVTKAASSLLADGVKQAWSSLRKHYSGADYLVIPGRADVSRIASVVERELQSEKVSPSDLIPYLQSPECVTLLEHILAYRLSGRIIEGDGPLYLELSHGAALHGVTRSDSLQSAFSLLTGVAALVLKVNEVTGGEELGDDGKQNAYNIVVEDTLKAIERHVRTLSEAQVGKIEDNRSLLASYLDSVGGVLGRIQPPSFDGVRNVPLESLYVTPRLKWVDSNHDIASVEELMQQPQTVVLGDPGGGKTTLVKKIASSLANGTMELFRGNERIIPFVVILRDYGTELLSTTISIAEFISRTARSTYQVNLTTAMVEWTLATGRAFVIFDGLDELLKTDSRRRIADAITAFSIRYPSVQTLVTSRRVGYSQAPLPSESFKVASLGDLSADQVDSYVANWFQLDPGLTSTERNRIKDSFIAESETVSDLRANPLMLALMCTIYRAEGYIPRNRPDMYEKCSRMLFDRWDRHRGLLEPFEFEAHVEPALMYMAYSIFCDEELQSGVPESHLVNLATNYLQTWQYADRAKATRAAQDFIEFCRGRAWIFSDVGLDADENSLFQFTHRTFLEFFTAAHLARVAPTLDDLCETLITRVERGEWDVVSQLALQIRAKPLQGGPDVVIQFLTNALKGANSIEIVSNLTAFTVCCLSFLIASPAVTEEVADVVVQCSIRMSEEERGVDARDSCDSTRGAAIEIRENLIAAMAESFTSRLLASTGTKVQLIAGLVWVFTDRHRLTGQLPPIDGIERLNEALSRTFVNNPSWPWSEVCRYRDGESSARELVSNLAEQLVYSNFEVPGVEVYLFPPVLDALQHTLYTSCDEPDKCDDHYYLVAEAGQILRQGPPPSRNPQSMAPWGIRADFFGRNGNVGRRHRALTAEELVSAGLILACQIEPKPEMKASEFLHRLVRTRLKPIISAFRLRLAGIESDHGGIPEVAGRSELIKWGRKEVSFLTNAARGLGGE